MTKVAASVATIAVLAGLAGGAYFAFGGKQEGMQRFAHCAEGSIAGGGAIGGAFELTDQFGTRVTDQDVLDQMSLVYFGYTYCPDICPVDTTRNVEAVEILEERGTEVQPVMITIDPQRDTPEVLADYVGNLHPRMVGLTGSEDDISKAALAYRAYRAKAPGNDGSDDYLMDHSTYTYLMAPGGQFLDIFRREVSPEEMAERVQCYVDAL